MFKLPEKANSFQDKLDDDDEIIDIYSTDDSSRDSFDFNAFFRNSDSKNAFFEVPIFSWYFLAATNFKICLI